MHILKTRWMIKEKTWKDHFLLMLKLNSKTKMNHLINKSILHEYDNKTMKYYELNSKLKHCFKCQEYEYISHFCKKYQKCEFCKNEYKSENCEHKKQSNRKRYAINKKTHMMWSFECSKRKKNIIRANNALRQKLKYHVERMIKDENTKKMMSIQFKEVVRFLKSSNKKKCIIHTLNRFKKFINKIINEENEQSELN